MLVFMFLLFALAACNFGEETGSEAGGSEGTSEEKEGSSDSTEEDKSVSLYFKNDIPDLNPLLTTDTISFSVLGNVMEGLYRLDENNQPVPAIAKGVEISEDGLTYTFTLREGVKWSNGDPVTSQDFRDGWLLGMNPDTSGSYRFILSDYIVNGEKYTKQKVTADEVGIETPDDQTLVVHLKQPTPYFLGLTTFVKYFPVNKEFYESTDGEFGLRADTLLYNGPFKITEFNPAQGATLVKNENYWDAENVEVEELDLRVIKEASTALNLYLSGELDYVYLSSENVNEFKDSPEFDTDTNFRSYYVQFNLGDKAMANINIRKALQHSYDQQTLEEAILNNGSEAAYGLIPPVMAQLNGESFREKQGSIVEPNVEKAKKLWKKGVEELGEEPELQLLVSDDTIAKDTATFLQSEWKKNLGADVELLTKPYSSRLEAMRNDEFQMVISAWGADYDDPSTYLDLWAAPADPFRGNFSNERYDELIASAKTEKDEAARMDMLLEAERILMVEEAVLAPLYYQGHAYLQNEDISGLNFHPWGNPWDYKNITFK